MASTKTLTLSKLPHTIACWVRSRKNRSTKLSQEALVGVKMRVKAPMARQPGLYLGMFVGGVVIDNEM
jgi:hypothetical protein